LTNCPEKAVPPSSGKMGLGGKSWKEKAENMFKQKFVTGAAKSPKGTKLYSLAREGGEARGKGGGAGREISSHA